MTEVFNSEFDHSPGKPGIWAPSTHPKDGGIAGRGSADFQSAVSQIFNLLNLQHDIARRKLDALQNAILRYGRLKICATVPPF